MMPRKSILRGATAVLFGFWYPEAFSHEAPSGWPYPRECCSDRDCVPLEESQVRATPDGFHITAGFWNWFVPKHAVRTSGDPHYHICVINQKVLCFFVPPGGV